MSWEDTRAWWLGAQALESDMGSSPCPALTSYVTMGKPLNLSMPEFPYLAAMMNNTVELIGLCENESVRV